MFGMIAGATLSVLGSMSDSKNQMKAQAAQEEARRKQKIQMVRQANHEDAALILQGNQMAQVYRAQMEHLNMAAIKNESTIKTAMGESNLEGRSMDRVQRDVENQTLKARTDMRENSKVEATNIYGQRESVRNNLIGALDGMPPTQFNSQFGSFVNAATAGFNGALAGKEAVASFKSLFG